MTEMRKVFLDTAPIIYFLDEDVNYFKKMECILEKCLQDGVILVTSVITCAEYFTYPLRTDNYGKISAFEDFMKDCVGMVKPVDWNVAVKAASIRSQYKDFKTVDCLQIASACIQNCDVFLTNDKQLRQFQEIRCVTVDEYLQQM